MLHCRCIVCLFKSLWSVNVQFRIDTSPRHFRHPNDHMLNVMGVSCLIHREEKVVEMYLLMELVPGGDLCSFINHPKVSACSGTKRCFGNALSV